jgi:hypothetical protein
MSGRWIRVDVAASRSRKMWRLAALLEIERAHAVGLMVGLWAWAYEQGGGDLRDATDAEIAEACGWRDDACALVSAIVEVGLLDGRRGDLRVHDWADYQPPASDAERQRKRRADAKATECHDASVTMSRCVRDMTSGSRDSVRDSVTPTDGRTRPTDIYPSNPQILNPNPITIDPTSKPATNNKPNPPPQPTPTDGPPSGVCATLQDLERWGHTRYGMLGGPQAAKLKRLLPLAREELDLAARTRGRSWAYLASVLESARREAAEPAPQPKPKAPPPHPLAATMREVAARVGLAEPERRWLEAIAERGIPTERVEAIAARVHAPHWGIVLDAIALDDRGESWAHLAL